MNTPDLVVGIDLGTTNSSIAAVIDGSVTVIPVAGQLSMPSAVGLDPTGRLIIGQAAKNQSVSAPESTLLSIKRLMGTEQTVTLGGKTYRPEEISALILGELKRAAEAHLGRSVTHAVITVPAFFNERQRQATQDAGKLAGLEVLRIINEPTAAALAYGAGSHGIQERETLLVYDLGGGTFDVSLVTVENGVVEVRASHGDTHLGGDDFDILLATEGEKRFQQQHPGEGGALTPATQRRLKAAMELAKIRLSDDPYATVHEEYLTPESHLETELARTDYEALIEPLLEKTLDCLQRSLSDAKVTAAQVDKIMLVGGATRTPFVHALLSSRLGKEPRHEINPDLIVAMGAAIQGAALAGQPAPAILIDISAHTYSIAALIGGMGGGFMPVRGCAPIVRRGTPLPVRKSEAFTTVHDNQDIIEVIVFQGEQPLPEGNLEIGKFLIEGLAAVPTGNEVVVEFQIDLNGLLKVTATEKRTGLAKSAVIDTAGHHRLNLDAARTNLAALFEEADAAHMHLEDDEDEDDDEDYITLEDVDSDAPASAAPAGLLATAKSLRRRAEALLERGVAETDAADLRTRLSGISHAIQHSDWPILTTHTDQLSDVLFYLED
ncbi:MAG: Hsp70 family protein [Prosthecobacter sp.]|uniref:Hsp70 family protein n=1 Tax=Prosthecobacter sp. TaxID=1965333 RepID=UPI0038FED051